MKKVASSSESSGGGGVARALSLTVGSGVKVAELQTATSYNLEGLGLMIYKP